jgi:putative transposase
MLFVKCFQICASTCAILQMSRNAAANSIPALASKACLEDTAYMTKQSIAQRTCKYRIYPSRAQTTRFNHTLALCCELYNAGLQERRDAYRLERKSVRYIEQANQLPEIKEIRPELNDIHSQVLQDVVRRLDKAFQAFFRRVKEHKGKAGFPRFKSRKRYDSFTYTQSGFALKDSKLRLSKIGDVRIKLHRPIDGKVKTLTVTRSATGKWYACFSVEVKTQPLPENHKAVGIDVGLASFATLSTGEQISNPRFFRSDEKALAQAQRQKKRKVAARVHERIRFRRNNFAHQLSHALVSMFGLIVFEDLNIKDMIRNRRLSKSIQDAAWNQLIRYTTYKAADAGRAVRAVDPCGTSQRCSACGAVVRKALSQRIHDCSCGLTLDRDVNAARNILGLGLQALGPMPKEAPSL